MRKVVLVGTLVATSCGGGGEGSTGSAETSTQTETGSGTVASTTDAASSSVDATDTDATGSASTDGGSDETGPGLPQSVDVHLVPQDGVSGTQRIVFAVPLAPGQLDDVDAVRVARAGTELATARRILAAHGDGSARSIQLQLELDIDGETDVTVQLGEQPTAGDLDPVPVEDTLVTPDGTLGPNVWAQLPASWLSDSHVAGPQLPADRATADEAAWATVCDVATYDVEAFLGQSTETGVWLYDRGTVAWRGYARTGDLVPLETAYRESAIYRAGLSGSDENTTIGVPGASDDLKYHYAQNMAIHYLLIGDDRFREAAEDVAMRAHALWPDPGYAGGADFWTERHAGFALLAYVWAEIVSDDRSATFAGWADEAVEAYVAVQDTYPAGYDDADARCFAHDADAHGESYGYFGCSPWMSAILADGLDAYVRERSGAPAETARASIVQLGTILARDGRDIDGRPFYWMGVGTDADEVDAYDEHWGESAYVIAMAWYWDGGDDAMLRQVADELVTGFATFAVVPHMRSFNWQCRSAVATPWYLQ